MLLSSQASTARLVSDTYLAKLLEGLSSLRAQSTLCDVTLEAEGICFPAHKIILASASNYLTWTVSSGLTK
uniref:BTB domain-containing protein n=1 Tax=Aquila chrysaetos chrysaetos TaxID=223781 RepID=A0A663F4A2_AQUCH